MLQDFRKSLVKTLFIPFFIIDDFLIEHTICNMLYVTVCTKQTVCISEKIPDYEEHDINRVVTGF